MTKRPPCPKSENGKHSWTFLRNAVQSSISYRADGSSVGRSRAVALYRCECGLMRKGQARHDQPGADLREHFKPSL